jgi:NAD(P)-dependent dehydrogenase (short-subunit alcohol dehydrogenase family)
MKKKHYIVIGGTKGIGRVIANDLAHEGHIVSVVGRKLAPDNKKNKNITHWLTDLADTNKRIETINQILSRNGKVSHIIFCQQFRNTHDDWAGQIEISLTATKHIIDLLTDAFDYTNDRSIVVISSVIGSLVATGQPLSYHIAKAGLNQMVRYFAVHLGLKGIRVNSVSPATVLKDEAKEFYYTKNKALLDLFGQIIPLGRMGSPHDVSDAVQFLCSKQSSYITGQDIKVDGGYSLLTQESLTRRLAAGVNPTHEKK